MHKVTVASQIKLGCFFVGLFVITRQIKHYSKLKCGRALALLAFISMRNDNMLLSLSFFVYVATFFQKQKTKRKKTKKKQKKTRKKRELHDYTFVIMYHSENNNSTKIAKIKNNKFCILKKFEIFKHNM